MSARTVAVILTAQVDDYMRQMRAAQRQTDEVDRAARTATEQLRIHNEALSSLGTGMAAVGAAAAVALGIAVKAASEYGSKMAQLQSLSHGTANEMKVLSDAAMKQGQAFGYSATQVAEAEIELTKAGRDTAAILGGDLKGALALAAAGQMDVAQATSIGVTALTQFAKSGATIPQVADSLAAGADKALGSVADLGMALQQGGLVASQMGLDLNDTVGTLSAFAQAGLIGSDAGTSLKTMLLALQSPSKQAKELLDQYNIAAYDQRGNFVGIAALAGQLTAAFKDKSQAERDAALSTIFGSDAIRSANVLYTQGKIGIQEWIDSVDDTGFASAQAAGKLNSLQGDVQKLSAAFETDLIKAGSSADGAFRGIVQSATAVVQIIGGIPGPVMGVGVAATALVAGIGLLGGAALLAIPKIVAFRVTLTELGISGRTAGMTFAKGAGLMVGLSLLTAGLAGAASQGQATSQQISLTGDAARKSFKDLDKLFNDGTIGQGATTLKEALRIEGFESSANKIASLNGILSMFSDGVRTNEGAFDALGQQLAGLAKQDYGQASQSFAGLVSQYKLGSDETKKLLDLMPAYRDELVHQSDAAGVRATSENILLAAQQKGAVGAKFLAAAQKEAATSAAAQAEQTAVLQGAASSATVSIDDLANTIQGFGSATLDARSAHRDFEKAIDDAREAAKKAGDATKDSTQADRDKQDSLENVARQAIAVAAAFAKQPGGIKKATDALQDGRDEFINTAKLMGIGRIAAEKYADKLGLIPANVKTAVGLSGVDGATGQLNTYLALVNGIPAYMRTKLSLDAVTSISFNGTGPLVTKAGGGEITGPGPKGIDSVYAILAPGEHVLTAAEVDRMGGQGAVSAFRADLMQSFAKGGPVSAIDHQTDVEQRAMDQEAAYQQQVIAQKRKADAASRATDAAQKRYDDIDGSKKNAAAKKAAKAAAEKAKDSADAASKLVDDLRDKRDKAKDAVSAARDSGAQLLLDREDFVSAERRGGQDPLAYVDQLRSMSRDDNYSKADRAKFDKQANEYEKQITAQIKSQDAYKKSIDDSTKTLDANKQTLDDNKKAVDDATSALESLKSTAAQFAAGISSSISGQYQATSAVTAATKDSTVDSGWFERDGIRYAQTTAVKGDPGGATTIGTLDDFYSNSANDTGVFAGQLQQLAGRSVDRKLLAEIAGYGPDKGGAIARTLLSANDGEFQRINNNFAATLVNSDRAGAMISDYTYGSAISAAQGNVDAAQATYAVQAAVVAAQTAFVASQQAAADQITLQMTSEGTQLRDVIGRAFGVKGYADGTESASAGIHWVGEHGPELVGFGGGERVLDAERSRRWVRGSAGGSQGQGATTRIVVEYPQSMALHDADGTFRGLVRAEARGVAQQEIRADAAQDAVLMMGGAA